jgi:hypothetical protein
VEQAVGSDCEDIYFQRAEDRVRQRMAMEEKSASSSEDEFDDK